MARDSTLIDQSSFSGQGGVRFASPPLRNRMKWWVDTSQRLPPPDSVFHHLRYWFPCKLRYLRPQHPRISGYHTLGVFGCSLFEKRPNSSHPSPRAPAPVSPPLATKSRSALLRRLPTSIPSDWDTVPLAPPSPPTASPSHQSDS